MIRYLLFLFLCPLTFAIAPVQQKIDTLNQLKLLLAQLREDTVHPDKEVEFEIEAELIAKDPKLVVNPAIDLIKTPYSKRRQIRQSRWRKLRSE
jgi:hypothetical protein